MSLEEAQVLAAESPVVLDVYYCSLIRVARSRNVIDWSQAQVPESVAPVEPTEITVPPETGLNTSEGESSSVRGKTRATRRTPRNRRKSKSRAVLPDAPDNSSS